MASINFQHGYDRHDFARATLLQSGSRRNLLLLAQTLPLRRRSGAPWSTRSGSPMASIARRRPRLASAWAGELSRTVGEADHEPGGTATVIGKYVKTGTAGPQTETGAPPPGSPPPIGLWAYLASVLRIEEHPFGVNPNPELVIAR